MLVVPSASEAEAVISADAPFDALSDISLASVSVSAGAVTSNSSESVTVTWIVWSAELPFVSEALITTSQGLDAQVMDSKSCPADDVKVRAPVVPSIENRLESTPP